MDALDLHEDARPNYSGVATFVELSCPSERKRYDENRKEESLG